MTTLLLLAAMGSLSPGDTGRCKQTTYCPRCSGMTCADGSRVRRGVVSASPNVPMHSRVWIEGYGELLVTDRGGAVKVGGGYTRKGETANFDCWVPRCKGDCWTGPGTRRLVRYRIISTPPPKVRHHR